MGVEDTKCFRSFIETNIYGTITFGLTIVADGLSISLLKH